MANWVLWAVGTMSWLVVVVACLRYLGRAWRGL